MPVLLSVEDGVLSNDISSVHIDSRGLLWAGTKNGINRYNGYHFRPFFTTASGNGYPGMQLTIKVTGDREGNIFVLNSGGFNRIDSRTGEIDRYPRMAFDSNFSRNSSLVDIYPAPDGTIWILTDRSLTSFSGDNNFTTWPLPEEFLNAGMVARALAVDARNNVWIGTASGLILFNTQQKEFREIVGAGVPGILSSNEVRCLYIDKNDYLWIGTNSGLNYVDPVEFEFFPYYPAGIKSASPLNMVNFISGNASGNLLLATSGGIVEFNQSENLFRTIYQATDTTINSVAVDLTGNIWAAADAGIIKIRKSRLPASNVNTRISSLRPGFRLAGDHVSALMAHGSGNKLFVGYRQDGFSAFDTRDFSGNHLNTLDGSPVVGFYPFRQQEYLVASQHDIEVFTPAARRTSILAIYPFMKRELLKSSVINCLFYDSRNSLWIGTDDGIQCVRIDSAKHYARRTLSYQSQNLAIGTVYDIEDDAAGNLWIGTNNGLIFYNPSRGNFNRLTPYDINLLNTEHKEVFAIVKENPGVLWLGTSAGVFRFDLGSREFTAISGISEIMNSSVKALDVDRNGNIWIGTERGLFNYIKSTRALKRYDVEEGLINNSYTSVSAGNAAYLFAGGPRGLSVIQAAGEPDSLDNPIVSITAVGYLENRADRQDLFFHVSDTIVLSLNRKPIQIEFAVSDLSRPEHNQYRYSFVKTRNEAEWHALGSRNYVILDRLSPGKYNFSVLGSGTDMNWSDKPTSLVIIVEAPYWRTRFGVAILVLAGMVLLFIFFRFWITQFFNLSRENQEREMFAKQIMLQKEELTLKNKAITDSINYAKRIQTAMLPPYKLFKSIFPSSFILFMPKDIVSGDFYWVNKVGNKIFIAAVDCTGHGVPGAFMSIIGFELFRKITNIEGLTRPSDILNRLNDDFHEIFKDVDNVVLRDGMDVAFCSIDKKDMILEFAGAFNPLYLIRDNKIMEVKGDRFAIGLDETNFREQTFKNHIIPIQKSDIVYIFSDGFADQFGGPDGKKYKYRRFRHLLLNLHQLPMEKQHEILENNVMEWRGEQEQVDDILVIGIKIDF